MLSHFTKVLRRPERPSLSSPSIPSPLTTYPSAPPPLSHCAVARYLLFNTLQRNSMLHRGHIGWGSFPSSKTTTMSQTFWCIKWTYIAVLFAARPGHISTGNLRGPPLNGKAMGYVHSSFPVVEVIQLHLSSAARPCCFFMFPDINPVAISSPHSLHCTHPFCRSR